MKARILVWTLLIASLVILSQLTTRFMRPEWLGRDDFVEYWSAGKLNATGGNPYDPSQMLALQNQVIKQIEPLMMWNLPWSLALITPFGVLPLFPASILWFLLNIILVFIAANFAWKYIGGSPNKVWIAWLVSFLFGPTLYVLKIGQIGPLLLLGVVGFLFFGQKDKWWLAGASLSLITIKPHLLYIVLLAIVVEALFHKNYKALGGIISGILGMQLISCVLNPSLVSQYYYAITRYPPNDFITATIGAALRIVFGAEKFWLQLLPTLVGSLWFLYYWWIRRNNWKWGDQISLLMLVSVATTAYGWTFDQVVLVIPAIQVALWCSEARWSLKILLLYIPYLVVSLLIIVLRVYQSSFWWSGAGFTLWYLWADRWIKGDDSPSILEMGLNATKNQ